MTKRILIITGIAVALLAVGATATYLALKQEIERAKLEQPAVTTPEEPAVQPEEPTTTEPIDTSDWETYRNEEFGFEIRFPRILLDLKRTYSTRVVGGINFRLSTQPLSDPFERYQFYGRKGYQYVQPNPCTPLEEGEHTEKNIGGVRFIRTEIKPSPGTRGLLAIEIHYLGKYGNICYHLIYIEHLPIKEDQLQANIMLFERIVSTFRLIKNK